MLLSSCVVPNLIHLLSSQNPSVVISALKTVGGIVALESDEQIQIDYTEVLVDHSIHSSML